MGAWTESLKLNTLSLEVNLIYDNIKAIMWGSEPLPRIRQHQGRWDTCWSVLSSSSPALFPSLSWISFLGLLQLQLFLLPREWRPPPTVAQILRRWCRNPHHHHPVETMPASLAKLRKQHRYTTFTVNPSKHVKQISNDNASLKDWGNSRMQPSFFHAFSCRF